MLTRKQHELLVFINGRLDEAGISPSFEEMKDALDLKSKSGVHRLISALEERQFIRRLPNRARALEVAGEITPGAFGCALSDAQRALRQPVSETAAAETLASFLGVLGFALMFNSPWLMAVTAASIGMVANVIRIQLIEFGAAPQAGAAAATLIVGLLAAWLAPRMRVPRITVSVPAVVIMVPGASAYRAVFFLNNGDMTQAIAYGMQAGLVVVAIAIGLAGARMLTDRNWAFEH